MNIAKWRYKLEIFKVKKFLCVMMLFVLAARVAYSENVGQETKTINNMPAYFTIGTNLLYWAALAPNVTAEYYSRTVIGLYRVPLLCLGGKGNPNTSIIRSGNTSWKADIG